MTGLSQDVIDPTWAVVEVHHQFNRLQPGVVCIFCIGAELPFHTLPVVVSDRVGVSHHHRLIPLPIKRKFGPGDEAGQGAGHE